MNKATVNLPTPAGNTSARTAQKISTTKATQLASEKMPDRVTKPQVKVVAVPTQEEPKRE